MGGFLDYNILNKNLRKTDLAKNKTINVFIYLLQFELIHLLLEDLKKETAIPLGLRVLFIIILKYILQDIQMVKTVYRLVKQMQKTTIFELKV